MVFKGLFGSFILLLIIASCMIEEVSSPKSKHLVIASDYLKDEDSVLFSGFTKSTGIEIEIQSASGIDIYNQIKNDPDNCGIDILMLSSESQLHKFSSAKFLQPLNELDSDEQGIQKFTSYKYNYVGFALDPFVIVTQKGSPSIRTYNDLTHNQFINDLTKNEAVCLLAPVSRKIPKGKAQEWVQAFYTQAIERSKINDSLRAIIPILTMRSTISRNESIYKNSDAIILRSGNAGSFYSLKTFSIVRQCENYTEAETFISYFTQPGKNNYLSKHLHFVSIYKPESVFRPYKISTEELFQYYTLIDRWLNKLEVK